MADPSPGPGPPPGPPPPAEATEDLFAGRIPLTGGSLRTTAARGTIVNTVFLTGVSALSLLKAFVVAAFLTPDDYGVWGILVAGLVTLLFLGQLGIGDKYIQQAEEDQEGAFQKAFTLNLLAMVGFTVLLLAAVPLLALVYGEPEVIAPGIVLALVVPLTGFTSPLWVYYRRMEFFKQRVFQAVDPAVGFIVTVALAIAGAGYWSLVLGTVAGLTVAAIVAVRVSPYPIRLRFAREDLREYFDFSWPLTIANVSRIVVAQSAILVGEWQLGLAAAGAITLAATIAQFTQKVDAVVTDTIYPAICAVRDRTELLLESFVKSNRLVLMWGVPFGVGIALFGPDLVEFVLGERWREATTLIQAFGIIGALAHIGFNWDAFFRARAETKPIAAVAAVSTVFYLAVPIPLLITGGLDAFAIGMAANMVVTLMARTWFLVKLFPAFQMAAHAARAILPSVPAVGAVLLVRVFEGAERTAGMAIAELALYLAVTIVATLVFERRLLAEMLGYLRKARAAGAAQPAAP
jgi:polysaccharide transporter, PST family